MTHSRPGSSPRLPRSVPYAREPRHVRGHPPPRSLAVTVCIAAICEGRHIVCIADRRITVRIEGASGDHVYEPDTSKIVDLPGPFLLAYSGLPDSVGEVLPSLRAEMPKLRKTRAVADKYAELFGA